MKKNLYSFNTHLDEMFGKKGTKSRTQFDKEYEEFSLNELLRAQRDEAGLTQKQMAKKMKTSTISISRWENHAQNLKISTLKKYATALDKRLEIRLV